MAAQQGMKKSILSFFCIRDMYFLRGWKMKIQEILVIIFMASLILSGCQKKGGQDNSFENEKENITIAFLYQDLENEWWISSHQAITTTLSERGIKVIEKNSHGDSERQLSQAK